MKKPYAIRDLTPENEICALAISCPGIYEIKDLTPQDKMCGIGIGCPSVYETKEGKCGPIVGGPSIEEYGDKYLIIGNIENPEDFGLEKKVGKGEILISIPKGIVDDMRK